MVETKVGDGFAAGIQDDDIVMVLDGTGQITSEFRFDRTATGWTICQEKLKSFPELAIAVEAGHSAAIE